MHIQMVSPEAVPFAKTGGLADVATGLSKALAELGHQVTLVMPCHRRFIPEQDRGERIAEVSVDLHHLSVKGIVRRTKIPDSSVDVLLVDQPTYFDRESLYTRGGHDYPDNAERFIFFSRAAFEIAHSLTLPDVMHVNDWQTGLIPALVAHHRKHDPRIARLASVLTIHNMAFHGQFPHWQMELTGLPKDYFNWRQMEYYGHLNLLKTGFTMADMVTTVSPTYAREICRPEYGYGLDSALLMRGDDVVGILNGVDVDVWNPAVDPHIAERYTPATVGVGKPKCKQALQRELGLHERSEPLLFGMVSRLTDQKGLDLITARMEDIISADVQFVFLGTGDKWYEESLRELQYRHPGRVATVIGFDDGLAHRIEAGADAYLMPSRFEPCGLSQMIAQRYGTLPIARATGGGERIVYANRAFESLSGFSCHELEGRGWAGDALEFLQLQANVRFDTSRLRQSQTISMPLTLAARNISLEHAVGGVLLASGCRASLEGETIVIELQEEH
jgi:starch synthase